MVCIHRQIPRAVEACAEEIICTKRSYYRSLISLDRITYFNERIVCIKRRVQLL